jgi:hypothetical protein
MTQPTLRLAVNNDNDNMAYKGFLPICRVIDLTISGSDGLTPWLIPAGTFVKEVVGMIVEGIDDTVDVGDEDTADCFIDNTEWTEATANSVVSSVLLTAPGGKYYAEAKLLTITLGGSASEGKLRLLITSWELGIMEPNQEYP